jgi:hypothetical protein
MKFVYKKKKDDIKEELGAGFNGTTYKIDRDGSFYALKIGKILKEEIEEFIKNDGKITKEMTRFGI